MQDFSHCVASGASQTILPFPDNHGVNPDADKLVTDNLEADNLDVENQEQDKKTAQNHLKMKFHLL